MEEVTHEQISPAESVITTIAITPQQEPGELVEIPTRDYPESLCSNVRIFI